MDENENVEVEKDPVDIIQELKATTVSKDEFEKLQAQNTKLLKALAAGETLTQEVEEKVDIQQLRNELYSPDSRDLNDIEYVTKTLKLRQAIIDHGDPDPFIPNGHKYSPTRDDIEAAERTAKVYQECLDYADGDNGLFINELMRRTRDVRIR